MRSLPNGKAISALGFGCASVWASPSYDEDTAQSLLSVLVEEGVNHFDVSPSYGNGVGERRLGEFLSGQDASRLVISTKAGWNLIDGVIVRGFDRKVIERSFDESLKRLGLERVDILYLHGPSIADLNDDIFEFLEGQKRRGRITYSGVNTFVPETLDHVANTPIDAVMLQYNVGDFRNAEQVDRLHAAGKIVMSGTALARAKFNLSTFIPRNRASLWYLLRMLRHDPKFILDGHRLGKRLEATGKPPTEAAIQFAVGQPKILSNLFGTTSIEHARANARAGRGTLAPEQWAALAER